MLFSTSLRRTSSSPPLAAVCFRRTRWSCALTLSCCCCRFYAGRLGHIPVVDRRSRFWCVRSVVCVQVGCCGRERPFSGVCSRGAFRWSRRPRARSRRTRHEGAEKDSDSGVLGMWYEHEYTRVWSRFIVVFSVFLSMLLALLASFTPSCCRRQKMASLDHANPPAHTQRCTHTQNSIACPSRVNSRAFQPKISDNSQNRSALKPLICSSTK